MKLSNTENAVFQRVKTKQIHDDELLHRQREGSRWASTTGWYYTTDIHTNAITRTHIDLEKYAHELGVLADDQGVAS